MQKDVLILGSIAIGISQAMSLTVYIKYRSPTGQSVTSSSEGPKQHSDTDMSLPWDGKNNLPRALRNKWKDVKAKLQPMVTLVHTLQLGNVVLSAIWQRATQSRVTRFLILAERIQADVG